MKTEITLQQPIAHGNWAYMVTRNNRPLAWGKAATKRQAMIEAAAACEPVRGGEYWRLLACALAAVAFGVVCRAVDLVDRARTVFVSLRR